MQTSKIYSINLLVKMHIQRLWGMGAKLLFQALILLSSFSTGANANVLDFTCGTIEFNINFERSTVSNTIDGTNSVELQYDGDWVRWNVKDTDEFYGVNVKTGDLILDGVVNEAGCRMGDTSSLSALPLSEGAYLRRAFIELPETIRLSIQTNLAKDGYYSSVVDGKWGRGTEAAIKKYIAEYQEELPVTNYSTSEGAEEAMKAAMSHMDIGSDCSNCEAEIVGSSVKEALDSEIVEVLSSSTADSFSQVNGCVNLGSVSMSDLENKATARVDIKNGMIDPSTIRPVLISGQTPSTQQLYLALERAILRCSTKLETYDGANRTVELTFYREKTTVTAYTTLQEMKRRETVKLAKLESEKKVAEAKRAAEMAEEKRKRDLEVAEQRAKAEAAEREKASATPEKLKTIEAKCSGSMTILAVCASLDDQDLTTALVGRGYDCSNQKLKNGAAYFGYKNICKKAKASVMIEEDRVVFSCESFNVCSYNVREVAELLIQEGFVGEMVPSVKFVNNVVLEEYCGRGSKQERLCASNDFDIIGQPIMVISMERNVSGAATPSFD